MYRLMIVDDDANVLNALRRTLSRTQEDRARYQIETFESPESALNRLRNCAFDLVLSDFRMPGMDGVRFLSEVKVMQPSAMRLIVSGYTDLEALIGAINEAQIFRFLAKPWHEYDLITAVTQALEHRGLQIENQKLADQVRIEQGKLTRHEAELKRLERESPGITRVNWGPDGSVLFEDMEASDIEDVNAMFTKDGKSL